MAKLNYLCIDDESGDTTKALLAPVANASKKIKFDFFHPNNFSTLLRKVRDKNPDGVILDIRLDEVADASGKRADFRGLAVAQELRTRMTEGTMTSAPIVLWSVAKKFEKSYSRDQSSHDLFDAVYDKEGDITDDPSRVGSELVSLSAGYLKIGRAGANRPDVLALLRISQAQSTTIDPRFLQFPKDLRNAPAHELVRELLHGMIQPSGPLIDEEVLAARLGVDIDKSPGWNRLKRKFEDECKYKGIFSDAWPRWWAASLIAWWDKQKDRPERLQRCTAQERVRYLSSKLRLPGLCPATPIDPDCSSTFWTICRVLRRPLDPADGVRISSANLPPFSDPQYMSIPAVLDRRHIQKGLDIDPLDLTRFEQIKNAKNAKSAKKK